ncbi:uncharacterized protein LTR77_000224 [Saxophila tyrrhenica]|uniref:Uncharacterized protein n=1 Tax=Saxophila tyrrhenica TaxID=1690608 RepID=A0AAV9PQ78_9PEZI|nr:hypothetical protein LTR77_000224 [Saxophila tyrrhenica]
MHRTNCCSSSSMCSKLESTDEQIDGAAMAENEAAVNGAREDGMSPADGSKTPSTSNDQSRPESSHSHLQVAGSGDGYDRPTSSGKSTTNQTGMRSSSSKFASLRAAFEHSPATDSAPIAARKRVVSSEKNRDLTEEQKHEYEAELAQLKEELSKEKELRAALEEERTVSENSVSDATAASAAEQKQDHEIEIGRLQEELETQKAMRVAAEAKATGAGNLQSQLARLQEQLEKEKEMRVAFEERVTSLEDEHEEMTGALQECDERWRAELEKRLTELDAEARVRMVTMAEESQKRQEEAATAQKQLVDLKQSIAASTRGTTEVSDATFTEDFGVLQHNIQNWVVNTFRRVKSEVSSEDMCMKLEKVAEPEQVQYLKPIYRQFEPAARFAIYQATVACHLMEVFGEPYLYGLKGQRDWARRSRQAADALRFVMDAETYNRWRVTTFDALRQSASIKEPVESAVNGITEMICITLQALTDSEDNESWQSSLTPIIHRAVSLAHLIRVQHARYEFVLPSAEEPFDHKIMDDVAEECDDGAERFVRCSTFPAITKLSYEEGDISETRKVVTRAKVVLTPGDGGAEP